MMHEILLQRDMFSGELVDTRTAAQKRRDEAQTQSRQIEMFSQKELAQFGVKSNPIMPLITKTALGLERQDIRTEAEKERDLNREAASKTKPMFSSCTAVVPYAPPETRIVVHQSKPDMVAVDKQAKAIPLLPVMPALLLLCAGEPLHD